VGRDPFLSLHRRGVPDEYRPAGQPRDTDLAADGDREARDCADRHPVRPPCRGEGTHHWRTTMPSPFSRLQPRIPVRSRQENLLHRLGDRIQQNVRHYLNPFR
jgi:hypothetical protein